MFVYIEHLKTDWAIWSTIYKIKMKWNKKCTHCYLNLEPWERHTVILFWLFLWFLERMVHCFSLWRSFPGNLIPSVTPLRGGAFKVGKKRKPVMDERGPEWVHTVGVSGEDDISVFSCPHTLAPCVMSSVPWWCSEAGLPRLAALHPGISCSGAVSQNKFLLALNHSVSVIHLQRPRIHRPSLSRQRGHHFFSTRTTTCCRPGFQ